MTKRQRQRYFRRVLTDSGLTQTAFAAKLGVTQGAVGQWYRGELEISLDTALLIEERFGADAGRLSLDVWRARLPLAKQPTNDAA